MPPRIDYTEARKLPVMDDYYEIIGVNRPASAEEIERRVRHELRIWTKRTNNPDLTRRQEAERRVQQLSEARKVLLDPARRAEYDRRPVSDSRPQEQPQTQNASVTGWLEEARRYLAGNEYFSAAYAAKQAREIDELNSEAWNILARSNIQLGNVTDALFEATRAIHLAPHEAAYHLDLAEVHEKLHNWNQALESYQLAQQLAPDVDEAKIGIASVLQQSGRHEKALDVLETMYAQSANKEAVGFQLGVALLVAAESVPRVQLSGGYAVTSPQEIVIMRSYVLRAHQVTQSPELVMPLNQVEQHLAWCSARHWQTRPWMMSGCFITVAVGTLLVVIVSLVGAISQGIGGFIGTLLFWGVLLGPVVALIYFTGSMPGWKINQRADPLQMPTPRPW